METKRRNIEKAVCTYFKVRPEDVYHGSKHTYPYNGAKPILAYVLYKNGVKIYDIEKLFNKSTRYAFKMIATVSIALKSDTKIRQDVEEINKLLSK